MHAVALDHKGWTERKRAVVLRVSSAKRVASMSIIPASTPDRTMSDLIVAIAARKDRDAFAILFAHFAPRVKSYLMRLGAGPEAAEELAQETLLTVWRRASAYDPKRAAASHGFSRSLGTCGSTWRAAIGVRLRQKIRSAIL